jgi:hypothetical protein
MPQQRDPLPGLTRWFERRPRRVSRTASGRLPQPRAPGSTSIAPTVRRELVGVLGLSWCRIARSNERTPSRGRRSGGSPVIDLGQLPTPQLLLRSQDGTNRTPARRRSTAYRRIRGTQRVRCSYGLVGLSVPRSAIASPAPRFRVATHSGCDTCPVRDGIAAYQPFMKAPERANYGERCKPRRPGI